MPAPNIKQYLDRNQVKYLTITHSPAYTAQEIAAAAHLPGKQMAKTVIVKLDDKMAMAVLPASFHVDLDLLRAAARAKRVELASEREFAGLFPECELGAMPPFGGLYGMDVYVADALAEDEEIFFNAGTHTELIRLAYRDFERLVQPKVLHFATLGVA